MKSSVVIGANYGDEGKGLMTDYLCKKHNADLVVRFNGGAQAGHTVVTPEGERHVFSHIGSGYFLGVPTYLSEFFILNPILFRKEMENLSVFKKQKSDIYISPKSEITTYWDMLGNRVMEEMRGDSPHGSCGAGINATLDRAKTFSLDLGEIWEEHHRDYIRFRIWMDTWILSTLQFYWEQKLKDFSKKVNKPIPEWSTECFNRGKEINKQFIEDLEFMLGTVILADLSTIFMNRQYAVFEGAQGLALDQFYGNFPYVTRSNTGMRNVLEMQRECQGDFSIDEIVYVSRTYETRHGYDPTFIGGELTFKNASFEPLDKTNIKNEWQGELRYRKLLYAHLADRIKLDLQANNLWGRQKETGTRIKLALTHFDQIGGMDIADYEEFRRRTNFSVPVVYESGGETREDVVERW